MESHGDDFTDKGSDHRIEIDVVILMAGQGRRLLPLTEDRPKALLLCEDGVSIFEHTVRSFITKDINATIIPVIGHGRQKVLDDVARLSNIANFSCATNPFYLKAGPMVSLWVGLMQSKNEKVLVINGDTIIKESLVANVKKWLHFKRDDVKPTVGICITKTNDLNKDDMKILVDDKGKFIKAGKNILPCPFVMKSAGVMCINDITGKDLLKEKLDLLLMDENSLKTSFYWHNILNEIKEIFSIDPIYLEAESWHEVDTEHDLILLDKNNK
jgi:L-glutamine-phosphate cytidylyltransferase